MDSSDDSLVEKLTLVPVMTALSGREDSLGLWIGTWICFTTQMSPLSSHVTTFRVSNATCGCVVAVVAGAFLVVAVVVVVVVGVVDVVVASVAGEDSEFSVTCDPERISSAAGVDGTSVVGR